MLDETPGAARASETPGHGGGGNGVLIAIGVIILLGAAGGILWWVGKKEPTPQNQTTTVTSASTGTTPPPESTVELPPLPTPEPDAGPDVGADAAEAGPKVVTNGGGGGGGGSCGGTCTGTVPTELRNFISGRGAAAKLCYRAALEAQEGLAGDITVSLRIASDGSLCSASIVSDSVGNANLATCVKQKMQTSYPAPKGGCVDQRVTINFKPQK
jgi:hypothetical protein